MKPIAPVLAGLAAACLACLTPRAACAQSAPGAAPAGPAPAAAAQGQWREPRAGLLTGGQPAPGDWAALKAHGVAMVVNLRPDAEMGGRNEAAEVAAAGMAYVGIPVAGADAIDADNARRLWTLLRATDAPVFVHCASANRVGALLALGAAQSGAMTPEAALDFGRRAGLTSLEPVVRERLGLPPAPPAPAAR